MAEPRARLRNKGQVFNTQDLSELLYAYGDNQHPRSLPSTISVLDEILTDFIIETCHAAALSASYSRRQKIKVDDFKFVLRKDEVLLGRVLEQLYREKTLKEARRVVDFDKMTEGTAGVGELEGIAEMGGAAKEMQKGKRRGRKRKVDAEEGEESPKKRATLVKSEE